MSARLVLVVLLGSALGCASAEYAAAPPPPPPPPFPAAMEPLAARGGGGAADEMNKSAQAEEGLVGGVAAAPTPTDADDGKGEAAAAADAEQEPGRVRSWFPEAFLWRPLVETGESGTTSLDVSVPDTLTTWRVLGLAHDRAGRQAGAELTFASTLPVYVDPVVPGWLYAGDRVLLPVQVVNTTDAPVSAHLEIRGEGPMTGLGSADVALAAGGSDVRAIPFDVVGAGEAHIAATLAAGSDSDAAERTIPVVPAGRPVVTTRAGTLASTRAFRLAPPDGVDATTEQIAVSVFPGPLAVLGAELDRIAGGARPVDPAYAYALSSRLGVMATTAGVELDAAALRRVRLLGWQRTIRASRAPSASEAADLLASLRGSEDDPAVADLVARLVPGAVGGQRADGVWGRSATGSLQSLLVNTAWVARALPEDQAGARLRATGAAERYLAEVKDPYTAAVLVASGLAQGSVADELQKRIADGLREDPVDGTVVVMPSDVVNPWGAPPSEAEVLAWLVLALPETTSARGDLASQLLSGWRPALGFGAGRADVLALEAIARALPGAASPVDVTLALDGVSVATGKLDPTQPKVPVTLLAAPGGADPEVTLTVSPAVPGLAFVATRRSWVPWSDADRLAGVEVSSQAGGLVVGREGVVELSLAAPSGAVVRLEVGLPAGAEVGDDVDGDGASIEVFTDRVAFTTRPFQPGEVQELAIPITPAFAGRFQSAPLEVAVDGGPPAVLAPVTYSVSPGP